jgi:taurine dioxygenase
LTCRQPQDAATVAAINDAWHEHIVLLFRGQALGIRGAYAFAGYFGEIGRHMRPKAIRNEAAELGPNVMLVSNIRENGKPIGSLPDGEMMFHSDTPYREQPDKATMLFAMEVPSVGGHTIFANSYMAAETLAGRRETPSCRSQGGACVRIRRRHKVGQIRP